VESLHQELREYTTGLMDDMSDAEVDAFISVVGRFVASGSARRARDLALEANQTA